MNDRPTEPTARRRRATIRSTDPAAVLRALGDPRAARGLSDLALLAQRARGNSIQPGERPDDDRAAWALAAVAALSVLLGETRRLLGDAVAVAAQLQIPAADVEAARRPADTASATPDPTSGPGALIERPPRRVRPPHDVRDDAFDHLEATDTDAWRMARLLDKRTALGEPLAGLPVGEYEDRVLGHVAGGDLSEVAVFVALLWRARQAAPVPMWSASGSA